MASTYRGVDYGHQRFWGTFPSPHSLERRRKLPFVDANDSPMIFAPRTSFASLGPISGGKSQPAKRACIQPDTMLVPRGDRALPQPLLMKDAEEPKRQLLLF